MKELLTLSSECTCGFENLLPLRQIKAINKIVNPNPPIKKKLERHPQKMVRYPPIKGATAEDKPMRGNTVENILTVSCRLNLSTIKALPTTEPTPPPTA